MFEISKKGLDKYKDDWFVHIIDGDWHFGKLLKNGDEFYSFHPQHDSDKKRKRYLEPGHSVRLKKGSNSFQTYKVKPSK